MENNILEKINEIFVKILKNKNLKISLTDTPETINGWDSLTHAQIITEVEEVFGIEFSLTELVEISDIAKLVSIIEKKK
ncbi:MAG: acyl carrier protein [Lentimicrobiaceae bacterium]|nr:acyl carrier protein [Lentimicrobiaceae bacterium]